MSAQICAGTKPPHPIRPRGLPWPPWTDGLMLLWPLAAPVGVQPLLLCRTHNPVTSTQRQRRALLLVASCLALSMEGQ